MLSANRLTELFEECGHEVRRYSGRFMYGDLCPGVAFDSIGEAFAAVADIAIFAAANVGEDEADDVRNAMLPAKTDDLGRGMILYFPNLVYEKEAPALASGDEEE